MSKIFLKKKEFLVEYFEFLSDAFIAATVRKYTSQKTSETAIEKTGGDGSAVSAKSNSESRSAALFFRGKIGSYGKLCF